MKREVLTEIKLRAMGKKVKEVVLSPGTLVTPSARDYARQFGIDIRFSAPAVRLPASASSPTTAEAEKSEGKFVCYDSGGRLDEKPEHFTHLYGNVLVQKDYPRIVFRGRLDLVQAHVIEAQVAAGKAGTPELVKDLDEVLTFLKKILSAEVKDGPIPEIRLLGFNEPELRLASHDPQKYVSHKHVIPSHEQGELGAKLNLLRTLVREAEIEGVRAFSGGPDQAQQRPDILQAMNRLSSAVYILMCKYLGDPV